MPCRCKPPLIPRALASNAIVVGDPAVIRWFLDHGADPNAYAQDRAHTPLSTAAHHGSLATVRLLLARGADARCGSPLHHAARSPVPGRLAVLACLLEAGAALDALESADHPRRFRTWSPRGLGTPLHAAAKAARVAMVGALLAKGADRSVRDTRGRTPLELAEEWEHGRIVELLRED